MRENTKDFLLWKKGQDCTKISKSLAFNAIPGKCRFLSHIWLLVAPPSEGPHRMASDMKFTDVEGAISKGNSWHGSPLYDRNCIQRGYSELNYNSGKVLNRYVNTWESMIPHMLKGCNITDSKFKNILWLIRMTLGLLLHTAAYSMGLYIAITSGIFSSNCQQSCKHAWFIL